ncbi:hypothetical protein BH11PSE12_BH11PSE12_16890 [soil metagenome]
MMATTKTKFLRCSKNRIAYFSTTVRKLFLLGNLLTDLLISLCLLFSSISVNFFKNKTICRKNLLSVSLRKFQESMT